MGTRALSAASRGWTSAADWQADAASVIAAEATALARLVPQSRVAGVCALCAGEDGFLSADASPSAYREGLACARCGCNARQRAAAQVLLDAIADRGVHPACARVYATEQASPLFVALKARLPRLLGSEHGLGLRRRLRLAFWLWRHGVRMWIRREDVTALRLREDSLDAVLSLDVLEHVPDFAAALREFARVLRPGGDLVLTVPFHDHSQASTQIAFLRGDGGIEHVGTPEFHGDPISGGVLCFHHFGWDLLDALRAAGFRDTVARRIQDAGAGLPQGQWILHARR